MCPTPVPLVPYHGGAVGELTVQDITVKYFGNFTSYDIYTILYSVNQPDDKLWVWVPKVEIDGEKEFRFRWRTRQPNEDVQVEYARLGLRELVRTPAKTCLEIDSVYIRGHRSQYPSYGQEQAAVAVLVRTLETPDELDATRIQRGLDGVWMEQQTFEAGTETMGYAFNDEALFAVVVNGFKALELIRHPIEQDDEYRYLGDCPEDWLEGKLPEQTCRARIASLAS